MRSLAERKLNAERLPWVKRVEPRPCEGIKWGTVALRDLYEWGPIKDPRPARGIQAKSRCKKQGRWQFTALKKSHARDGVYCYHHLISHGLYCDMDEQDRTSLWYLKNGWVDA